MNPKPAFFYVFNLIKCIKDNAPCIQFIVSYEQGERLLIVDLLEYKSRKTIVETKPKPIPVIKVFKPTLLDSCPFHYTEIKKEQK